MEININTKKVKISELKPNEWNPKLKAGEDFDVEQQYAEVVKSIKNYGLIDPILVRSSCDKKKLGYYEIINGYHRYLACKDLKFKEIVINDLGDISDQKAKKLTIVTEEVKIPIDQSKLSVLLKEMLNSEDLDKLAEGLPYSKELIESKVQLLDFDWEKVEENNGELNEAPLNELVSPEGTSINLIFDSEKDRIKVDELFIAIMKEQEATSVPEALVLLTKSYGKQKKDN